MLHTITDFLVATVGSWGYAGIFLLMFLESSFFPFPSEVVMIPAGYLAYQGQMSLLLVIVIGTVGALVGAWFNYFLAAHFGRAFLARFIAHDTLDKMDAFFQKHGPISTFNGRLIPVFRQYISFPAGLARMPGGTFTLYTLTGAGIWITILTLLGYFLGSNQERIAQNLKHVTIGAVLFVIVLTVGYVWWRRRRG